VGFKVPGRIVDLPIEEGQQVEQGALLARLDDADYKQRVSIDEATVRVRDSSLALTLAGTRQQEVKAAQQTMKDAEADLDEKKIDNQRAQQLFVKDEFRRRSATWQRPRRSGLKRFSKRLSSATTKPSRAAARKTSP